MNRDDRSLSMDLSRLGLLLGVTLLLLNLSATAAAQCDRPQMLLTVDKSSSMLGELSVGLTKWDAAVMAIRTMTTSFESDIDFGLQIFPRPNRCGAGEVIVDIGRNLSSTIVSSLGSPPPSGGNYTPTFETLDVAASYGPLRNTARRNFMTLITDGEQWCDPYNPDLRFNMVQSVERLRSLGITVFVVGFGAGVDALALNRAAAAAGTATPGCNPASSDPMAANNCYLAALDSIALQNALAGIADVATAEDCNGFDDDCDGDIDEGYDQDSDTYTVCGTRPGVEAPPMAPLVDCNDMNATVRPGAMELCDGLDNDCDGATDPGCDCTAGQTRDCGSAEGACMPGTQSCTAGRWGACTGGVRPGAETCNAADEDCDGVIDETVICPMGTICVAGNCMSSVEPPPPVTDSDGDGLPDGDDDECPGGVEQDTDMDGIPNCYDNDDDNDGILTVDERPDGADQDTDRDGNPNHLDPDDDGDSVPTRNERPGGADTDTDGDGLPDHHDPDDDGDTLPTFDERPGNTSPDTDADGPPDYLDPDDDGDGIPTAQEIIDDPSNGDDLDRDGVASHRDTDSDGDGFSDMMEMRVDVDGDGMWDYLDPDYPGNSAPTPTGFGVSGGALGPCAAGGTGAAGLLPLLVLLVLRRRRRD